MKPLACHTKGIHASGYAKIHGVKPCIFFMQIRFFFFRAEPAIHCKGSLPL